MAWWPRNTSINSRTKDALTQDSNALVLESNTPALKANANALDPNVVELDSSAVMVEIIGNGDLASVDIYGAKTLVPVRGINASNKAGGYLPAECFRGIIIEDADHRIPPGAEFYLELNETICDSNGRPLAYVYLTPPISQMNNNSLKVIAIPPSGEPITPTGH